MSCTCTTMNKEMCITPKRKTSKRRNAFQEVTRVCAQNKRIPIPLNAIRTAAMTENELLLGKATDEWPIFRTLVT